MWNTSMLRYRVKARIAEVIGLGGVDLAGVDGIQLAVDGVGD